MRTLAGKQITVEPRKTSRKNIRLGLSWQSADWVTEETVVLSTAKTLHMFKNDTAFEQPTQLGANQTSFGRISNYRPRCKRIIERG